MPASTLTPERLRHVTLKANTRVQTATPSARASPQRRSQLTGWATRHVRLMLGVSIALLLLVVFAMRLLTLTELPPGFGPDELALVQEARSDPSLLPSSSDAPYGPSYHWLARLTGMIDGWSIRAARFPAALFGTIAAVTLVGLTRRVSSGPASPAMVLVFGLVAASTFPMLLFSGRADPAIVGCALAAIGLFCLHEASCSPAGSTRRGAWWSGAATALGLGLYSHIVFVFIVPLAIVVGISRIALYRTDAARIDRAGQSLALALLIVLSVPVAGQILAEPASLRGWLEIDWNGDGTLGRVRSPWGIVEGYAITWRSLVWDGYDGWLVNLPGRPLLDPLLAFWSGLGLLILLRHPLQATYTLTLGWLVIGLLPAALVAPGHPGLMLPAVPAMVVCVTLGVDAALRRARSRGPMLLRAVAVTVVVSSLASASWSAYSYVQLWGGADDTYFAYRGNIRDALSTSERLAGTSDMPVPVYVSLPLSPDPGDPASDVRALAAFLSPGTSEEGWIDGRTTLILPTTGSAVIVYPASAQPDPALRALLSAAGQTAIETGRTPQGETAREAWRVDERTRAALPYAVPTIRFPDGFELIGFSVAPDLGTVATTGLLPDPPRIAVTLVWSALVSSGPHTVQVQLVPSGAGIDSAAAEAATRSATIIISPSETVVNGSVRELIVTRLSVIVPNVPNADDGTEAPNDIVLDVQAGLLAADGRQLPALDPPIAAAGDFAHLDRIEYIADAR